MTVARPQLSNVPRQLDFNHDYTVDVVIPPGLDTRASSIKGRSVQFHSSHYSSQFQ